MCFAFSSRSYEHTMDQEDQVSSYNVKMCHKGKHYKFVFGMKQDDHTIEFRGQGIRPEKLEDLIFKTKILVDGQLTTEHNYTYQEIQELFQQAQDSKVVQEAIQKYLPTTEVKVKVKGKVKGKGKGTGQVPRLTAPKKTKAVSHSIKPKSSESHEEIKEGVQNSTLEPGTQPGYVVNPLTNKEIKVGGPTYQKLCREGYTCDY